MLLFTHSIQYILIFLYCLTSVVIIYLCYRTAKVLKILGWCLKLPHLLLSWTQSKMLVWYWHKYKKKKNSVSFLNFKNNFKATYIIVTFPAGLETTRLMIWNKKEGLFGPFIFSVASIILTNILSLLLSRGIWACFFIAKLLPSLNNKNQ